ncbi:MAG: hypothetical protein ACRDPU_04685 [Thermoleophilia bacterium]
MTLSRPVLILVLALLLAAATGGALAQTGGGGVIQGCVSRTGAVELITAENTACEPTQEAIAWNQQGPKGDKGDRGEAGDRLSPEATAIQQQAENTLSKTNLGKPKLSKQQTEKVANLDPAPGEAFQLLRSTKMELKDWYKTEQYTFVGRLALPKGRFGLVLTARATVAAGAADYPSTYQGRVRCLLSAPGTADPTEGQGAIALQRAVTLKNDVNQVTLHCTGWAAHLSMVRLVATRLRKVTTYGQ